MNAKNKHIKLTVTKHCSLNHAPSDTSLQMAIIHIDMTKDFVIQYIAYYSMLCKTNGEKINIMLSRTHAQKLCPTTEKKTKHEHKDVLLSLHCLEGF